MTLLPTCGNVFKYKGTNMAVKPINKKWTNGDLLVLRRLWVDAGWTMTQIGRKLGRPRGSVSGKIDRLGLKRIDAATSVTPPTPKQREKRVIKRRRTKAQMLEARANEVKKKVVRRRTRNADGKLEFAVQPEPQVTIAQQSLQGVMPSKVQIEDEGGDRVNVTILKLVECRAIVGRTDSGVALWCNRKRKPGKVYCSDHFEVYTNKFDPNYKAKKRNWKNTHV